MALAVGPTAWKTGRRMRVHVQGLASSTDAQSLAEEVLTLRKANADVEQQLKQAKADSQRARRELNSARQALVQSACLLDQLVLPPAIEQETFWPVSAAGAGPGTPSVTSPGWAHPSWTGGTDSSNGGACDAVQPAQEQQQQQQGPAASWAAADGFTAASDTPSIITSSSSGSNPVHAGRPGSARGSRPPPPAASSTLGSSPLPAVEESARELQLCAAPAPTAQDGSGDGTAPAAAAVSVGGLHGTSSSNSSSCGTYRLGSPGTGIHEDTPSTSVPPQQAAAAAAAPSSQGVPPIQQQQQQQQQPTSEAAGSRIAFSSAGRFSFPVYTRKAPSTAAAQGPAVPTAAAARANQFSARPMTASPRVSNLITALRPSSAALPGTSTISSSGSLQQQAPRDSCSSSSNPGSISSLRAPAQAPDLSSSRGAGNGSSSSSRSSSMPGSSRTAQASPGRGWSAPGGAFSSSGSSSSSCYYSPDSSRRAGGRAGMPVVPPLQLSAITATGLVSPGRLRMSAGGNTSSSGGGWSSGGSSRSPRPFSSCSTARPLSAPTAASAAAAVADTSRTLSQQAYLIEALKDHNSALRSEVTTLKQQVTELRSESLKAQLEETQQQLAKYMVECRQQADLAVELHKQLQESQAAAAAATKRVHQVEFALQEVGASLQEALDSAGEPTPSSHDVGSLLCVVGAVIDVDAFSPATRLPEAQRLHTALVLLAQMVRKRLPVQVYRRHVQQSRMGRSTLTKVDPAHERELQLLHFLLAHQQRLADTLLPFTAAKTNPGLLLPPAAAPAAADAAAASSSTAYYAVVAPSKRGAAAGGSPHTARGPRPSSVAAAAAAGCMHGAAADGSGQGSQQEWVATEEGGRAGHQGAEDLLAAVETGSSDGSISDAAQEVDD